MHRDQDMRLYCGDGPNSYRVRIFMAEKGIEVPQVRIDFEKGEHRSAEFLKLNSLGQIPVLVLDDGTVITESVAICRYLEELHPTPPLFGAGPRRRAARSRCGTGASSSRCSARSAMWRCTRSSSSRTGWSSSRHSPRPSARRCPQKWAWLDRELADGRAFLAGDDFSVADISGGGRRLARRCLRNGDTGISSPTCTAGSTVCRRVRAGMRRRSDRNDAEQALPIQ